MEISEDEGEDTEVDANRKSDVCSQYRENEGFDKYELYLEETLPLEEQGDLHYIVDNLYNQFEVEKDDYESEIIVGCYLKNVIFFLKERYFIDTRKKIIGFSHCTGY